MSETSNQAQPQESAGWLRTGANWWNQLKNNEAAAWIIEKVTDNAETLAAAVEEYSPTAGKIIAALPTVNSAANFLGSGLTVAANYSEGNLRSQESVGEMVSLAAQSVGLHHEDIGEGIGSAQEFTANLLGTEEAPDEVGPAQQEAPAQQVGWLRSAANMFDGVKEKLGGGTLEWGLDKIADNSEDIAACIADYSPALGTAIAAVPYVKAGMSFLMSGASAAADYQEGNVLSQKFAENTANMGAQVAKVTGFDQVASVLEEGRDAVAPVMEIYDKVSAGVSSGVTSTREALAAGVSSTKDALAAGGAALKAVGPSVRELLMGAGSGAGGQGVQQGNAQSVEQGASGGPRVRR